MSGNGEEQQTEGEAKKHTTFATNASNSQTQGQETSELEQGISKLGHEVEGSPAPAAASASAPAPTQEAQHDITIAADTEHHEPKKEKKDKRPRDSKGWDGKLRLPKKTDGAADGSPEPGSGDEDEESGKEDDVGGPITRGVVRVEREEGPAPEELEADEDLLEGMDSDEEDINLVHYKIRSLPALNLGVFRRLKVCWMSRSYSLTRCERGHS